MEAVCVINEKKIKGTVIIQEDIINKNVIISVNLSGIPPGLHGFHIHEYGDLREGCSSLCHHYNPKNKNHGGPNDKERHVGDLGNIEANKKGIVNMKFVDKEVKLRGKYSVIGRSIVIHEDPDDLHSDTMAAMSVTQAPMLYCFYDKQNRTAYAYAKIGFV